MYVWIFVAFKVVELMIISNVYDHLRFLWSAEYLLS